MPCDCEEKSCPDDCPDKGMHHTCKSYACKKCDPIIIEALKPEPLKARFPNDHTDKEKHKRDLKDILLEINKLADEVKEKIKMLE